MGRRRGLRSQRQRARRCGARCRADHVHRHGFRRRHADQRQRHAVGRPARCAGGIGRRGRLSSGCQPVQELPHPPAQPFARRVPAAGRTPLEPDRSQQLPRHADRARNACHARGRMGQGAPASSRWQPAPPVGRVHGDLREAQFRGWLDHHGRNGAIGRRIHRRRHAGPVDHQQGRHDRRGHPDGLGQRTRWTF